MLSIYICLSTAYIAIHFFQIGVLALRGHRSLNQPLDVEIVQLSLVFAQSAAMQQAKCGTKEAIRIGLNTGSGLSVSVFRFLFSAFHSPFSVFCF